MRCDVFECLAHDASDTAKLSNTLKSLAILALKNSEKEQFVEKSR